MKTNRQLRKEAREALKGNWAPAIIAAIVYFVIICAVESPVIKAQIVTANDTEMVQDMVGNNDFVALTQYYSEAYSGIWPTYLLMLFVFIPLSVGIYNAFRLLYANGDTAVTSNMFRHGFTKYFHNLWGLLLTNIFIVLWSLLLIVPGIIKAFSYSMTTLILRDEPELSANQAIERSMKLMAGKKLKLFGLYLSFLGWVLLCFLTLGIGLIWLGPYMMTSLAAFYEDLKADEAVSEISRA